MKRRPALEITLLYALFGGVWIVVSDRLVESVFAGQSALLLVQTLKGLVYVGVTAGLVYWLAARAWQRTEDRLARLRRAEERARRSEARYRALVNANPLAVFSLDPRGKVLIWNAAAERMFGWSAAEAQREMLPIVPEDKQSEFAALRKRVLEGELVAGQEIERVRKDGSLLEVSLHAAPVADDDGEIVGIMAVIEEIGERKRRERELRESRRMLQRAERLAGVGSWVWDLDSDTVTWSEQVYRIFGLEPGSAAPGYAEHPDLLEPEDMARLDEAVQRAIADGTPYRLQIRARRPDGEVRHCVIHGRAEASAEGPVTRLFGSVQDITERVVAARALEASEEKFRSVVENAPDGIFIQRGRQFAYVNPAGARLLGAESPEELLGRDVLDHVARVDRETLRERERALIEEGKTLGLREETLLTLDSDPVTVEMAATPLEYEGEAAILVFVRDIRPRKRQEATTERLRQAMEQSAEAIVITDADGRVEFANPAFERLTGYSRSDVVGRPRRELRAGEGDQSFEEIRQIVADGQVWRGRLEHGRQDERGYTCDVSVAPIVDGAGEVSGYVEVQRDVSRRISLERRLQASQRLESVGRLAGGIAHDFNNMLTVIAGHADLVLDREEISEPIRADVKEIQRAAERSARLVGQLLSFARRQVVSPKLVDINTALEERLDMLRRLIGEDVQLRWNPGHDSGVVRIDPGQIDQILTNLVVNAREAIEDVGAVTVKTAGVEVDEAYCETHVAAAPGPYTVLTVSDTGRGMDQETLDHIFEPFFTTRQHRGGTGLGLATVYGIVRQNGGFINVYSEPGDGSTFRIYLPRAEDADRSEAQQQLPTEVRGGGETILVVEDEASLLALTKRILTRLGYDAHGAGGATEALERARELGESLDLLMTDVVMPEMNGRDLADRVLELCPAARCLFMSGYTADVVVDRGVVDEEVLFLEKPFTAGDLAAKVREALGD